MPDQDGSQAEFEDLVRAVRDYAILSLDPDGYITSWNQGAERIKGYRAEEIIGRHFSAFYPHEDIEAGKTERELAEATRGAPSGSSGGGSARTAPDSGPMW